MLLGGQPGSGKSRVVTAISQRHPDRLVSLAGDELRQFHPESDRLRREKLHVNVCTAEGFGETDTGRSGGRCPHQACRFALS